MERRQIVVAGVRLHYLEVSPATASPLAPLVLLHQLLATAETLVGLMERLQPEGAPQRRMVALDLLSATPVDGGPLDTRAASMTALVAAFLKALQLERPVLIGHSYGGLLALGLASSADVELSAVALLAAAHPFAGYRPHVVAFYLTRWGRFWALCIPLAPGWGIRWAFNQAAGPARNITPRQVAPHLRVLRHRDSLRRVLAILSTWETDMALLRATMLARPIALPALLLWGDHDNVVPLESATALDLSLPTSERHTLTGRGHLLPEEAPEACAALILRWLAKLPAEQPARLAHPV